MPKLDVLLIDDETRRMRATLDMLRADKYSAEQIASPAAALKRLQDNPKLCRVIILDIMMPADGIFAEMNTDFGLRTGIFLLEKLREINGFDIPIIVLTANSDFRTELQQRVNVFLQKPVAYQTLKKEIDKLMLAKGGA